MARIFKQSRSPYWFADYHLANGRRRRVSTKKTNRAAAKLILDELIAEAMPPVPDPPRGARSRREAVIEIVDPVSGERVSSTAPEKLAAWIAKKSPATAMRYRQAVTSLLENLTPRTGKGARNQRTPDESAQGNITLREIARLAGVGLATASYALRNNRNVSQTTREHVQKLASKLDYKPNPMVSALMASRVRLRKSADRQVIAYLNTFTTSTEWRKSATFVDYYEGAEERAAQSGYRLEEFSLNDLRAGSRSISDILYHRGIHGILIGPMRRQAGHLSLKWERFSVAALGYSMTHPAVHRATADHLQGIRIAFRHLRKLGYRRIGLVMNPWQDTRANKLWSAGAAEHKLFLPSRQQVRPFYHAYETRSKNTPRFRPWLEREQPDAIVAGSPTVGTWLQGAGFQIPEDLGMAVLDRTLNDNTYSGIYLNGRDVGAAAIDLVIGQINRNEHGLPKVPKRTTINSCWLDGKSTRVTDKRTGRTGISRLSAARGTDAR